MVRLVYNSIYNLNLITIISISKKIIITYFGGPWLKTIGITANKKSHFLGWKG